MWNKLLTDGQLKPCRFPKTNLRNSKINNRRRTLRNNVIFPLFILLFSSHFLSIIIDFVNIFFQDVADINWILRRLILPPHKFKIPYSFSEIYDVQSYNFISHIPENFEKYFVTGVHHLQHNSSLNIEIFGFINDRIHKEEIHLKCSVLCKNSKYILSSWNQQKDLNCKAGISKS